MSSAWAPALLGVPMEAERVNPPTGDKALQGLSWDLSEGLDPSQPHHLAPTPLSSPFLSWPWPPGSGSVFCHLILPGSEL